MKPEQHWSKVAERGSLIGIEILIFIYRVFGKGIFRICLTPVMFYYYLTGTDARKATWTYLDHLYSSDNKPKKQGFAKFCDGLKVFFSFGLSIVDKFDAWLGKVDSKDVDLIGDESYQEILTGDGAVLISAHLGNMEVCRTIFSDKRPLNIISSNTHSPAFNSFMKKANADANINFFHIDNFGIGDTIKLKQKIEDKEAVIIFADRTSMNNPNNVNFVPFLGEEAPFGVGPFALATLMECPVYTIFCLKEQGRYRTYVEKLADPVKINRKERQVYFKTLTEAFAQRLEKYVRLAPYQWYNFFNFWQSVSKPDNELADKPATEPSKKSDSE